MTLTLEKAPKVNTPNLISKTKFGKHKKRNIFDNEIIQRDAFSSTVYYDFHLSFCLLYWNYFKIFINQINLKIIAESSGYTTESTDSSFSSATSTTSTGTVVCNFNALKPKNNQTHSVSQTSLSSGITTAASTKQSTPTVDKSNKCHLLQCSYANLTPSSSQMDQPTSQTSSTTSNNHGTIMMITD